MDPFFLETIIAAISEVQEVRPQTYARVKQELQPQFEIHIFMKVSSSIRTSVVAVHISVLGSKAAVYSPKPSKPQTPNPERQTSFAPNRCGGTATGGAAFLGLVRPRWEGCRAV